eukprot:gb/GECH01014895.1/.p1 GENE.gb/GECH01014895.1/~~gb/GECH01014895.1/.p1  ORF type:complete len:956 (+),score=273.55 gb/GECH01014895.1/:1-2868(+)
MSNEIDEFERTLHRLGVSKENQISKNDMQQSLHTIPPSSHLEQLRNELDSESIHANSKNYFQRVKERRKIEKEARKDRDERRRKVLVEQKRLLNQVREQENQQKLIDTLLTQSNEEQELAQKIMETRRQKDIMIENRKLRQKRQEERRIKDKEEQAKRNELKLEREQEKSEIHVSKLKESYEETVKKRKQEKHDKHYSKCSEIFDQLFNLSMRYIDDKEKSESPMESKEWKELKTLFVKGQPILIPSENEDEQANQVIDTLNEEELTQYLNNQGYNEFIFDVLKDIFHKIEPPPEKLEPFKSKYPLRLLVIGKPWSGKTELCKHVSEKYSLKIIDPFTIISNAIEAFKENIEDREIIEIGKEIQEKLKKGFKVDNETLSKLIAKEISKIENLEEKFNGWILDNFPNSADSLMLLDRILTDQESYGIPPKSISLFLPVDEAYKISSFPEESVFSMCISLEPTNEWIFHKISNLRIDPNTKQLYDIKESPPNDLELVDKLKPIDEYFVDKSNVVEESFFFNLRFQELREIYTPLTKILNVSKPHDWDTIDSNLDQIFYHEKRESPESAESLKQEDSEEISKSNEESSNVEVDIENDETSRDERNISVEEGKLLMEEWRKFEQHYKQHAQKIFQKNRSLRISMKKRFKNLKKTFTHFIERKDNRQELVEDLREKFNSVDNDLRMTEQVKEDLHSKTDELRKQLWNMADKRKEEESKELSEIKNNQWIEKQENMIVKLSTELLQLEIDRFSHTKKFTEDYYAEKYDVYLSSEYKEPEEDLIEWDITSADQEKKKDKKKGKRAKSASEKPTDPLEQFKQISEKAKSWIEESECQITEGSQIESYKEQVNQVINREKELFYNRVDNITNHVRDTLQNIEDTETQYREAFNQMIQNSYEKQHQVISGVINTIQDHIETEEPLHSSLQIGIETFSIIESNALPSDPKTPPPIYEQETNNQQKK